jgi:hypothetical protein
MEKKKRNSLNDKFKIIHYCDLSGNEERKIRLIATLLVQSCDGLDATTVKELGAQLMFFLDTKMLLDHLFWGRVIVPEMFSEKYKRTELEVLRKRLNTLEVENE